LSGENKFNSLIQILKALLAKYRWAANW